MNLIDLTEVNGTEITLNMDRAIAITDYNGHAFIVFETCNYHVVETKGYVLDALKGG